MAKVVYCSSKSSKHFFKETEKLRNICHKKKQYLGKYACVVVYLQHITSNKHFSSLLTYLFSVTVAFICEIGGTPEIILRDHSALLDELTSPLL